MRAILESTIRAFVAKGSGIDRRNVVPGLTSNEPPEGLYASVTAMSDRPMSHPMIFQQIGPTESYTQTVNCIETMFSIQWYRDGAVDAAYKFADWVTSHTGLDWASTAIVDGRILGANVYAGGSGYLDGETCVFSAIDAPSPNIPANGYITTNGRGEANGILMTNAGDGYYEPPVIVIDSANGTGAVTSPRGYGFAVKSPVMVRNITGMIAGDYEERAQVDLIVTYDRPHNDRESGRIERIIGERESGGATDIIDSEGSVEFPTPPINQEDRLVYVFQTNLVPSNPDSSTSVGSAGDGITIDRIAEWTKNSNTITAGGSGFHETTLFATSAITPQHGRNLIAVSPFITNYEGHISITFPTLTSGAIYSIVYYIKTTHAIPNQPAITSVRAVKFTDFTFTTGFTAPISMTDFNSMVILDNNLPNGGLIGLQLDLGVAVYSNRSATEIDQVVKELNTQQSVSITPNRNLSYNLSGFNTRVTFLQYDLTTTS